MSDRISLELLAVRVAAELQPGQVATIGAGLPSTVMEYVPLDRGVVFHTENGVVGGAAGPERGPEEPDLVDAGGDPMGVGPGGAIVDAADSFGMIRGGHVDVVLVEGAQVSERGDLAAREEPGSGPRGLRGPADIIAGAKSLVVMMEHTTRDRAPRIVRECTYPVTGSGCVSLIVTDVAVMRVVQEGLILKEIAPGWNVGEVQEITEAGLILDPDLKEMAFSQPAGVRADKVFASGAEALADMPDGAVVLMDGFGGPGGMAQYLITALRDQGAKNITLVSNTAGIARVAGFGTPPGLITIDHSLLIENGQVGKAIASFPVSPSPSRPNAFEVMYKRGEVDLELVPQGTLAERIRAGANGVAAFYTPTGAGTSIAEGRETRGFGGREYVLEDAIRGDYALIRAHKADRMGNLVYRGTSRNFNAVMAPAAAITIAEVDEMVEAGELDPDAVVTPGIFVQRIVQRPADFYPYERAD